MQVVYYPDPAIDETKITRLRKSDNGNLTPIRFRLSSKDMCLVSAILTIEKRLRESKAVISTSVENTLLQKKATEEGLSGT